MFYYLITKLLIYTMEVYSGIFQKLSIEKEYLSLVIVYFKFFHAHLNMKGRRHQ
jgi:hypothetical protein